MKSFRKMNTSIPINHRLKSRAKLFLLAILTQLLVTIATAQTSGPSTPEVQGFTPSDIGGHVNHFTGDFQYSIPLLDIGGYPISLSYTSNIGPKDEASYVGLGWNLNPGVINRQVRGLPDDFAGERVTKHFNIKDEKTLGVGTGFSAEFTGFDFEKFAASLGGTLSMGFSHNNYHGWDAELGFSNGIKAGLKTGDSKLSVSFAPKINLSAKKGASYGLSSAMKFGDDYSSIGAGIGLSGTSREGLKSAYFDVSFTHKWFVPMKYRFPINFASHTYTPTFEMPTRHISGTANIKAGGEAGLWLLGGNIEFYFARQSLVSNADSVEAFGYIYAHEAGSGRVLMDMNREKDGPYRKENPNLPIPAFTHDLFAVSGEGITGSFRPFRGDVGTIFDPYTSTESTGIAGGAEVGAGNLFHAGADIKVNKTKNFTRKWQNGNELSEHFQFRGLDPDNPLYEPVYFKSVGELTTMANEDLFRRLGGFEPVTVPVNSDGTSQSQLVNPLEGFATTFSQVEETLKSSREIRNTHFSYLTADEAQFLGLERYINDYPGQRQDLPPFRLQSYPHERVDDVRKGHHLSEITVTRADGTRYVFGLPAYNVLKKEVSFNISADGLVPDGSGLVDYTPGVDNSIENERGKNNYFQSTETPPYAYAYLLTAIVSQDYVDITADGPTPDDFGTYTKFNYQRSHSNYKWRMPYEQNKAYHNPGNLTDHDDDMASYVYGEKEVWYLNSIETKNYVAEFILSDREDAFQVLDENGGKDTSTALQRLDEIRLYAQADRLQNGPNAVPIKTVFFEYNYELVDDSEEVFSTAGGKLTLTGVSFAYGESEKERFSPYTMGYAQNPNYEVNTSDRWGTYKGNDLSRPNTRFPYSHQDKTQSDQLASSWLLNTINTPEGGQLEIEYEADDYGHVQDKRSMTMQEIVGFSADIPSSSSTLESRLYDTASLEVNRYLVFRLKASIATDLSDPDKAAILGEYFEGIEECYFNCMVDIWGNERAPGAPRTVVEYESVAGFVPLQPFTYGEDYGLITEDLAWMRIPETGLGDDEEGTGTHPISKATWQKLRHSLPKLAFPIGREPSGDDPLAFVALMGEAMASITEFFENPHQQMRSKGRGSLVDLDQSFIRLNSPDQRKIGGGARVKRVVLHDRWGQMTGDPTQNFQYGKEYFYDKEEAWNDTLRVVSSGVASYEPLVGGDENAFSLPARYRIGRSLALDLNLYAIEPFGELFFPAPQVGYSQVRVRNLPHPQVSRTATGLTRYEFYTAKDFPTIAKNTEINQNGKKELMVPPFYSQKNVTVAQGFSIEVNDMHGKPKAVKVYQEQDLENPISGVNYFYHTDPENDQRLVNEVTVINDSTGIAETKLIGVEYDLAIDAREISSETRAPGVQINTDGFLASIIPIIVPIPYPEFSYAEARYKGIATSKLIQRSGLLKEVVAYDLGSIQSTKTIAYDGKTGHSVVQAVTDEFEGTYYDTKIPSHWIYDGMGHAFQNQGVQFDSLRVIGGHLLRADIAQYFSVGDEVALFSYDMEDVTTSGTPSAQRRIPPFRAWVMQVIPGVVSLIDQQGRPISNGSYDVKVIRSGRRNKFGNVAGEVLSKKNPITATQRLDFEEVLDASATTFNEHWQTYAGFLSHSPSSSCQCTPVRYNEEFTINIFTRFLQDVFAEDGGLLDIDTTYSSLGGGIGSGLKIYQVERNGHRLDVIIRNPETRQQCSITMETSDGSPFPSWIQRFESASELLAFDNYTCQDISAFEWIVVYLNPLNQEEQQVAVTISTNCMDFLDCSEVISEFGYVECGVDEGEQVNPFVLGILGNWRAESQYKYITDRSPVSTDHQDKGHYESFAPYWDPLTFDFVTPTNKHAWQRAELSTIIDPFGKPLETKDPLERRASSTLGYDFNLQTTSVANARYHDAAFDGFEDYDFRNYIETPFASCPLPPHWRFDRSTANIVDTHSHTGLSSLRLDAGGSISLSRVIQPLCEPEDRLITGGPTYDLESCDLIKTYAPTAGSYILSAWVLESSRASLSKETYDAPTISIVVPGGGGSVTLTPVGNVIDGWQRIEGIFQVPEGTSGAVTVTLENTSTSFATAVYFDDVRLQPFNSNMEAFVYDPVTLRLMAVLDPNNYATYYEYDGEGLLTRTKKETERGIMTLQEVRSAKPKSR